MKAKTLMQRARELMRSAHAWDKRAKRQAYLASTRTDGHFAANAKINKEQAKKERAQARALMERHNKHMKKRRAQKARAQ